MTSPTPTPAPTAIHGEAITRDGVRLSYTRHPAAVEGAPRVALVHSLALDRSLWSGVVAGLAGEAEAVVLDCRGHGASDRPRQRYTTEQFADDVADLFDHLGWSTAVIGGCSMGGCVAQHFASRHRDRTSGALLVDTTAWYGPTAPADWASRAQAGRDRGLATLIPFQLSRWFGDAFRTGEPELMARLTEVFTANDVECYAAACAMLGEADLRESAALIPHPTAVLVGEDDGATPPAMAHDLAARIGDGPATVVPGTRHLTPLENPGVVVDALRGIFARLDGRGRS